MTPLIKCPHAKENVSPKYHDFDLASVIEDDNLIHYCKNCKTVISVENYRAIRILYALSNKMDLNE
jgi:hypothetical protein